jgi:hypothetical protein
LSKYNKNGYIYLSLKNKKMNFLPTTPETLRRRLTEGAVQFAFKKLDGSLRTAIGTTDLSSIPEISHPQGVRKSSDKVIVFFDIEKSEWRSVSILREIYL